MGKHGAVVRVKHRKAGNVQIRTGAKVLEELTRLAQGISEAATSNAHAAGFEDLGYKGLEGMDVDVSKGKGPDRHARASVRTATFQAVRAEATDRSLTKAFRAAKK